MTYFPVKQNIWAVYSYKGGFKSNPSYLIGKSGWGLSSLARHTAADRNWATEHCRLHTHPNQLLDEEDEGEMNELDLDHIVLEMKKFLPTDI